MTGDACLWVGFALGVLATLTLIGVAGTLVSHHAPRHMPPTWRRETWRQHEDR